MGRKNIRPFLMPFSTSIKQNANGRPLPLELPLCGKPYINIFAAEEMKVRGKPFTPNSAPKQDMKPENRNKLTKPILNSQSVKGTQESSKVNKRYDLSEKSMGENIVSGRVLLTPLSYSRSILLVFKIKLKPRFYFKRRRKLKGY